MKEVCSFCLFRYCFNFNGKAIRVPDFSASIHTSPRALAALSYDLNYYSYLVEDTEVAFCFANLGYHCLKTQSSLPLQYGLKTQDFVGKGKIYQSYVYLESAETEVVRSLTWAIV